MQLIDPALGRVLIEAVQARGIWPRMRGLIGRPPPGTGTGMILRARQVHTLGMAFPIDAVYLGEDGSVIRIVRLAPWRIGPFEPRARWVLEVPADDAAALGIHQGQVLEMKR